MGDEILLTVLAEDHLLRRAQPAQREGRTEGHREGAEGQHAGTERDEARRGGQIGHAPILEA